MQEIKRVTFKVPNSEIGGKLESLCYFFDMSQQKMIEKAIEDCWERTYEKFPNELDVLKKLYDKNKN